MKAQDKDDELYEHMLSLTKVLKRIEDNIKLLTEITIRMPQEQKELDELKQYQRITEGILFKGTNYLMNTIGGAVNVYTQAKQMAENDKDLKKELKKMKPYIDKYLKEENSLNN